MASRAYSGRHSVRPLRRLAGGRAPSDPEIVAALDCAGGGVTPPSPLTAHPDDQPIRGSCRRPTTVPRSAQPSDQAVGRVHLEGGQVHSVNDGGIIGQAYGRKIHAREVVAIDEAGDGLCWVRLTRFDDEWLLIRSDARDVSRAVRKLRQIPAGEQSDRFPEVGP